MIQAKEFIQKIDEIDESTKLKRITMYCGRLEFSKLYTKGYKQLSIVPSKLLDCSFVEPSKS